jgi:UDP-glucuronate 4-epimerase
LQGPTRNDDSRALVNSNSRAARLRCTSFARPRSRIKREHLSIGFTLIRMKTLLTGAAGFIGMSTALRLLARGDEVLGIDNLNDYYDVQLKADRLERLRTYPNFSFKKIDISDRAAMAQAFATTDLERVVHLAAQAGVRYSLQNPHAYIESNIVGFMNVLEGCRSIGAAHLVYASSSSVYGGNTHMPFSERHNVDHPVSLYAATKKANELMAHTYSHLYGLPTTGLRFFTVYGPWGRPDMALFLFTKAILEGRPIDVYNHGDMARDFTYIDDIVDGIVKVLDRPAAPDSAFKPEEPDAASSNAPYRLFNIGTHQPVPLLDFIGHIESALGRTAERRMLPLQSGDVPRTYADVSALKKWVDVSPVTSIKDGIASFVRWYREYYQV